MESSRPNRTAPSRPGRFHRGRALAVTVLAAGTAVAALAPVTERRLGNAVLLTHDGYGHVSQADPSTCVMQALGRYFTGLATPARGTICPSDHGPFDPGFGQPAASR
jgi:TAP-like protein